MGRYGEKPDAEGFDSLCPLVLLSGTCLWQDMRNWLGMKHFPLKISGEASSQRSSRFVGMGCVHSSCVCQPAVVCVSQQSCVSASSPWHSGGLTSWLLLSGLGSDGFLGVW